MTWSDWVLPQLVLLLLDLSSDLLCSLLALGLWLLGPGSKISSNLAPLHGRILVHFLHSHAFGHKTNSFLKCQELLIRHYVRVDLLAEEVQSLISDIKFVHPSVIGRETQRLHHLMDIAELVVA